MKRMLAAAALSAALIAGAHALPTNTESPFDTPCKTEGQNACYWDASKQGNHKGTSYVVTKSGQVFRFAPDASRYPKHPFHK